MKEYQHLRFLLHINECLSTDLFAQDLLTPAVGQKPWEFQHLANSTFSDLLHSPVSWSFVLLDIPKILVQVLLMSHPDRWWLPASPSPLPLVPPRSPLQWNRCILCSISTLGVHFCPASFQWDGFLHVSALLCRVITSLLGCPILLLHDVLWLVHSGHSPKDDWLFTDAGLRLPWLLHFSVASFHHLKWQALSNL